MDNIENIANFNNDNVVSKKFTGDKWKQSEKPLDPVEHARNQILVNLGENKITSNVMDTGLIAIGDYCYLSIREKLIKPLKLNKIEAVKSNKKEEKINTKTKLILNNVQSSLELKLNEILNYFKEGVERLNYNFLINKYNYIEFRFIILMKYIEVYISNRNIEELKEILITIKKIKNTLKNPDIVFEKIAKIDKFDFTISKQALDDLFCKEAEIENIRNFRLNIVEIVNTNPKLIFQTKYDGILDIIKLKPYETQEQVMNVIKTNIHNGFNVHYKTIQGGGKTSLILSVAKYIKHSNENIKIIFCCSDMLEAVRVHVAKIMFNFNVHFGVASAQKNTNGQYLYEIKNSWICKKIDKVKESLYDLTISQTVNYEKIKMDDVIICDYISTLLMLKENDEIKNYEKQNNITETKSFDYLLFFDEPTYACGSINNIINIMCQILYHAPNKLILSSATLPPLNELDVFNRFFLDKYTTSLLSDVKSNKVLIGCLIRNYHGNILTPHNHCANREELNMFISKFVERPLIGKFYTLIYLINLNDFLVQYGENLNLNEIENFNHSSIIENIIILFNRIIQNREIPFENFLNVQCGNSEVYNVEYSKLLTSDAHKFMGGCLISVSNPLEFVRTHFYSIVDNIKKRLNVESITDEYEKYLSSLNEIQLRIDALNKNFDKKEQNYDNELCEIYKGTYALKFNDVFELGTMENLKSFSSNFKYDESLLKVKISREELNVNEYTIEDNLKFLLYMGVGIYSNYYSENYRDKVLELLNERKLFYFISDESYIYGGNGPLSNIIIDDSLGNKLNDNELSQLIGRTGRVGKSWISKIYVQENTYEKLRNYFQNFDVVNIESINISNTFIQTVQNENEKIEREKLEREKLEREKIEREKLELERLEREKIERENFLRLEIIRIKNEKSEKERLEKERLEHEKKLFKSESETKTFMRIEQTFTSQNSNTTKTWRRSETIIMNNNSKTKIIKEEKIMENVKDNSDKLLKFYK